MHVAARLSTELGGSRGERFINDPSLIEISEFQGSIERLQVGDSNFQRETGERISRVSIKGRTKRKDKVSRPISILVSKRVFNRRHARTCIAHDMRRARIRAREFFRAVHWPFFFLSKTCPRDANLFIFGRI